MNAVRLEDVQVRIGADTILGPISLRVGAGERWALLGPNGSGKTTLLSIAGAWRHPSSGSAWVLGNRLGGTDVRTLRERVGHIGHGVSDRISLGLTVREVVLTGRSSTLVTWFQGFGPADRAEADARLAQVGCGSLGDRPLATCSQGERQRVLLARALFGRPELLLFDEPAAGLDLPGRETLLAAMDDVARAGDAPTTITATHHLEELASTTTHAALLREGTLIAAGPVAEALSDRSLSRAFDMTIRVGTQRGRWSAQAG